MNAIELRLDALRQEGAHRLDPIRFHYLEALARRLPSQPASVQGLLMARLQSALGDYIDRCKLAARSVEPDGARAILSPCTPLAELNRYIQTQMKAGHEEPWLSEGAATSDMKSVRRFGEVWQKMVAQDQVDQAMERGPVNAGPLNSHMLVLRSLAMARDLSPDYLRRYLSQVNTLLWLEQASEQVKGAKPKQGSRNRPKKQG